MERGFQAMLLRGESSGDMLPEFTGKTTDETYINDLYSSLNAQSFLLHSLDYGYGTFPTVDSAAVGYEYYPASQSKEVTECLANVDWKLKIPKCEPSSNEVVSDVPTEPFDFIAKCFDSVSRDRNLRFLQLPELQSLEQGHDGFGFPESPGKRVKSVSSTCPDSRTLESMVRNFQLSNYFTGVQPPEIQPPAVVPASTLARLRRQRLSEKTRCLQKLLPWDKKMDMATMLEEAYKYVKFLQAQISVLQSMPGDSSSSFATQNPSHFNLFGGLGKLNRQQLLQVLVNSPVVQTTLYSKGCCVYSIEQLVLLKKIAERKALFQQMVLHPSTVP
ncbi:uncharacterized protein LOC130790708 [Actinidia eriantha]|uniref:uncharacterized protein LOC130790708 n=1 Tax=Actinidia eriantha TaxID=165200 RepID=UPI0025862782|nr:uncharacterized protein LOC130790708 [Actinidia eriantha]